jgi:hypothetical protein
MQNPLLAQLDLVEQQFSQVAAFLAGGDAPGLQVASAELQRLSVELSRQLQAPHINPAIRKSARQRVKEMALGLQILRDNLSRQSAVNQMALNVVVPAPARSTYSGGSSVYGSVARQGGVQKFLSA